jgi:hypothetical protein
MTSRLLPAVLLVVACCVACGDADASGPRAVATAFEDALGSGDGAAACTFLAPGTLMALEQSSGSACADAILGQDLPEAEDAEGSVAYGSMAQVRFANETLFLSEFDGDWRVLAAGCTPADARFDCAIQGG